MSSALTLYVAWHPRCAAGEFLAREVFQWFHSPGDDLLRAGLGLPVFFRSLPKAGCDAPPAIDAAGAEYNVLLVLADEHMASDPAWTDWLSQQSQDAEKVRVVPVALHPAGFRLPPSITRLNFLRVDDRDPSATVEPAPGRWVAPLLRQLTEVLGRDLMQRLSRNAASQANGQAAAPPALTVFVSHAKRDGMEVAEALRDAIEESTRLQVFFDDNDLPVGHGFADALRQAAGIESAAMIAVVTDAYAARPWCRREVELARWPRREPGQAAIWSNCPLLVVQQLAGTPTRHIPELGNATVVGWREQSALQAVDLLMREVVLSGFHRLMARGVPAQPGRHVISWAPDASSLLMLQGAAQEVVREVVYPGHALPGLERQALRQLFPQLELRTFEEVMRKSGSANKPARDRLVGLSFGYHDELGRLGFGRVHFEEAALRVGRLVTECGGRMVFGGMLGSSGLTESLQRLARAITADDDPAQGGLGSAARILSYQRWPSLPDASRVAEDKGIAEYVCIPNPLPKSEQISFDRRVFSPERARQDALTLSAMRWAMTRGGMLTRDNVIAPAQDARIFLGGLSSDFNGVMPGLLEEALYALEAGQAIFVLGGFGGAAALLAQALLTGVLPPELSMSTHLKPGSRFSLLCASPAEQERASLLFEQLGAALLAAHGAPNFGLNNGLNADENRQLMQSDHLIQVLDLLRSGFERLWTAA